MFELLLVDRLHAKLYVADDRCLAGSANVTLSALGETTGAGNIEVLVDTSVDDPGVSETLATIDREATPASDLMADAVRRLADALPSSDTFTDVKLWHPFSRRPQHAFRVYSERVNGYVIAADRLLLADVARSDIAPGLSEQEFRHAIRDLLAAIPITATILTATGDTLLTRADVNAYFETLATDDFTAEEIWEAFVQWMSHFYDDMVMRQEVSEVALRRAQLLADS